MPALLFCNLSFNTISKHLTSGFDDLWKKHFSLAKDCTVTYNGKEYVLQPELFEILDTSRVPAYLTVTEWQCILWLKCRVCSRRSIFFLSESFFPRMSQSVPALSSDGNYDSSSEDPFFSSSQSKRTVLQANGISSEESSDYEADDCVFDKPTSGQSLSAPRSIEVLLTSNCFEFFWHLLEFGERRPQLRRDGG